MSVCVCGGGRRPDELGVSSAPCPKRKDGLNVSRDVMLSCKTEDASLTTERAEHTLVSVFPTHRTYYTCEQTYSIQTT